MFRLRDEWLRLCYITPKDMLAGYQQEIQAIGALEAAKNDFEHAAHDFGGHRVEAIEAINRALHQLHKALEYDR